MIATKVATMSILFEDFAPDFKVGKIPNNPFPVFSSQILVQVQKLDAAYDTRQQGAT